MDFQTLKIFLCLSFALCGMISQAQIDSLQIPPIFKEINDSIKHYQLIDSLKTMSYIEEAEKIAEEQNSDQLRAYCQYFIGRLNTDFPNDELAEESFSKALHMAMSLDYVDHKLLASIYNNYGYFRSSIGDFAGSRKFNRLSYQHTQHLDDISELATASYTIAMGYSMDGNFRDALRFINQALEYDMELKDSAAIATDLAFLAAMHFKLKDYQETLTHHQKALSYINKEKESIQYAGQLNAIADAAVGMEEYAYSVKMANQAIDIYAQYDHPFYSLVPRIHRAHADYYLGNKERAWSELNEVYDISVKNNLVWITMRSLYIMGRIEENPDRSAEYLIQGVDLAKQLDHKGFQMAIHSGLNTRLDKTTNDLLNLEYSKKYIKLLEERSEDNLKALTSGLDAKFELLTMEEMNQRLELKSAKQELALAKQKTRMAVLFASMFIFLGLVLAAYQYNKQQRKIKELEYEEELNNLQNRLAEIINRDNSKIHLPTFVNINSNLENKLTNKEYEILREIISRKSNKEIAAAHFISINTVKFHLKNIYAKLDVPNKKRVLEKIQKIEA